MVKRFRKQLQLISGQPISLISFSILCWYIDGKLLSSMMKSKTSCSGQQLPLISGQQLLHLQNLIRNDHPGWWKVKTAVPVSGSFGFLFVIVDQINLVLWRCLSIGSGCSICKHSKRLVLMMDLLVTSCQHPPPHHLKFFHTPSSPPHSFSPPYVEKIIITFSSSL